MSKKIKTQKELDSFLEERVDEFKKLVEKIM